MFCLATCSGLVILHFFCFCVPLSEFFDLDIFFIQLHLFDLNGFLYINPVARFEFLVGILAFKIYSFNFSKFISQLALMFAVRSFFILTENIILLLILFCFQPCSAAHLLPAISRNSLLHLFSFFFALAILCLLC